MYSTTQQQVKFVAEPSALGSVEVGELGTEIARKIAFASSIATSTRFMCSRKILIKTSLDQSR